MPSTTDVTFRGKLPQQPDDGVAYYIAAAPPDYRSSFTGSAMPFTDSQQAFYNTPNRGSTRVQQDGSFEVHLVMPNSYYVGLGTVRVPPTLHVVYHTDGRRMQKAMQISRGVPFRALTYPNKRTGPMFYASEAQFIRSQEEILYASAYPDINAEPDNFWGERPAR
jgi:hypothetical protein